MPIGDVMAGKFRSLDWAFRIQPTAGTGLPHFFILSIPTADNDAGEWAAR